MMPSAVLCSSEWGRTLGGLAHPVPGDCLSGQGVSARLSSKRFLEN